MTYNFEEMYNAVERHYRKNDKAHDLSHLKDVQTMLDKYVDSNVLNLTQEEINIAKTAIIFHDTGCHFNREYHHVHSAHIFLDYCDWFKPNISEESKTEVVNAILEHRASFKGVRTSKVSNLVACCDIGVLSFSTMVERMINFRIDKCKRIILESGDMYNHLIDKFSPNGGYVWKSIPKEIYMALEENKANVDELNRICLLPKEEVEQLIIGEILNYQLKVAK